VNIELVVMRKNGFERQNRFNAKSSMSLCHDWTSHLLSVALPLALHFMITCTREIAANQNAQTQILAL
jgi:hypothetical protein